MLPVFSFEEEAELFLRLGGYEDNSKGRQSGAAEIVSVLYGSCAGAKSVALDPPPGMVAQSMTGLVSMCRGPFVKGLLGREIDSAEPS